MTPDQLAEHLRFAAELGITGVSRDTAWRTRVAATGLESATSAAMSSAPSHNLTQGPSAQDSDRAIPLSAVSAVPVVRSDALAALKTEIGPDCTRCKLHALGRTQVVFGVGNPEARLMFVGEAPGGDEDIQGVPFVGRAGQLLTKIIESIGLSRDDVYIANVIKCRPPQNRNPEPDEVERCEPFLFRQIDIVRPHVIVALGKFAAQALLRTLDPISRLRGRVFDYRGSRLVPTFHPAYLLRNPASKREVWEDMKLVKRLLAEAVPPGS